MERCPNCGSTVRSGAKFCTICGFRLTIAESAVPTNETTAPNGAESSVAAATGAATLDPVDSSSGSAEPATTSTWPSGRSQPSPSADDGAGTEANAEAPPREADVPCFPDWPASTWSASTSAPAETPETVDPVSDAASASAAPLTDAPDAEPSPLPAAPPEGPESSEVATEPADEFAWFAAPATDAPVDTERPAWFTSRQEDVAPDSSAPPAEAGAAGGAESDRDLQRAHDLLDELRGIVASLATRPADAPSAVDVASAVAELSAARDHAAASAETFAGLHAPLAEARTRPRDIDAVLALAGQAETISALQEAYDRYAAAVERALEALQAGE